MEKVHYETPALRTSVDSLEFVEQLASFRKEDGDQSSENLEVQIHDIPDEVLAMIFMEIDSITRKRIERVCKKWLKILRGVKVLRTHVKLDIGDRRSLGIELPLRSVTVVEEFLTPETELLHFNGCSKLSVDMGNVGDLDVVEDPSRDWECSRSADILLTNTKVVISLDIFQDLKLFKRMIFRDVDIAPVIPVYYEQHHVMYCQYGTMSFGELVLNLVDDLNQLAKIYFNDAGPLTESKNRDLVRLTDIRVFSIKELEGYEKSFSKIGLEVDLRAMLADVAAGRNIPRFIAEVLADKDFDFDQTRRILGL